MNDRAVNRAGRWAYSLMEVTVGMAAASMLVVGVGSTVYVASQGTSGAAAGSSPVVSGSFVMEQIAAEMQYAVSFNERSASAVEFTIADRDGDTFAETIRYSWSGTPGDPLVRTFNGASQNIAEDVHTFNLDYRVQTVSQTTSNSGGSTESGETLLASFTGWSGITPSVLNRSLSTAYWSAECFKPDWPAGADSLKITRVRLMMSKSSGTGDYSVGICRASGGTGPEPGTAIGTTQTVSGAALTTTAAWQDITFSDVTLTSTTDDYVILIKGVTSSPRVQYLLSTSAPADSTVHMYTLNSGGSWSPTSSSQNYYDLPFYVYGTYTMTTNTETTVDRDFVRSVGVGLQVGSDATSRIDTSSEVLNAPEVTGS